MFSIKSLRTIAMLTMIFFICFTLPGDFSYSNDKNPQEQKKDEFALKNGEIPSKNSMNKSDSDTNVRPNVIEKTGYKKKRKKFPWLVVIGGAVVLGVALYFLLKKKKEDTQTDDTQESDKGTILVDSMPGEADIWLDGVSTGQKTASLVKYVSPGTHTIRLIKSGFWDMQKTVQVETGKQSEVKFALLETTVKWIYIPEGEFTMGYELVNNSTNISHDKFDSKPYMEPPHPVYLDHYYIAKYEITFEEYDKFCDETGHRRSSDFGWGRGTMPAIDIGYNDAVAFCKWISEKTGINIHIPTEAQWEKAARGTDGRLLPWSSDDFLPLPMYANFFSVIGKPVPVGSYPLGVSPYGVHDMGGNVTEWCQDWFGWDYYKVQPYKNPTGPETGTDRIRRGGDWRAHPNLVYTTWRLFNYPTNPKRLGFRIVMEVE